MRPFNASVHGEIHLARTVLQAMTVEGIVQQQMQHLLLCLVGPGLFPHLSYQIRCRECYNGLCIIVVLIYVQPVQMCCNPRT